MSITVLYILLISMYVTACVCYKLSSVRYVQVRVHMSTWGGEKNQEKGLGSRSSLQTPGPDCPGKRSSEGVPYATPSDSRPHHLTAHSW